MRARERDASEGRKEGTANGDRRSTANFVFLKMGNSAVCQIVGRQVHGSRQRRVARCREFGIGSPSRYHGRGMPPEPLRAPLLFPAFFACRDNQFQFRSKGSRKKRCRRRGPKLLRGVTLFIWASGDPSQSIPSHSWKIIECGSPLTDFKWLE